MTNSSLLKLGSKYLKGTGKVQGLEAEIVDAYLREDIRKNVDYFLFTEQMWKFIKERYGYDHEIKRIFIKKNKLSPITEAQIHLKQVPIFIAALNDVQGICINNRISCIQVSKNCTFREFKLRIQDIMKTKREQSFK